MKTIYPFMGLALCGIAAQAQEKPNFLIIQCDHLTQRVVGAYGHTQDCTLPIDEVASRGVIFSNAYVGCPLSQPSRAALWSGMMPHQTNVPVSYTHLTLHSTSRRQRQMCIRDSLIKLTYAPTPANRSIHLYRKTFRH